MNICFDVSLRYSLESALKIRGLGSFIKDNYFVLNIKDFPRAAKHKIIITVLFNTHNWFLHTLPIMSQLQSIKAFSSCYCVVKQN